MSFRNDIHTAHDRIFQNDSLLRNRDCGSKESAHGKIEQQDYKME